MRSRFRSRHGQVLLCATVFMFILMISGPTLAIRGTRNATPEEKAFYNLTMDTFAKAVPPGPNGWTQSGGIGEDDEMEKVGTKSRKLPFTAEYHIAWEDTKRRQEAEVSIEAALKSIEDESSDAALAELIQKKEELQKEADEAAADGDLEKADSLSKEIAEIDAALNIDDTEAKQAKIYSDLLPRDVSINIWIRMNSFEVSFYDPAVQLEPIAESMAFQVAGKELNSHEWEPAYTYVFLGAGWNLQNTDKGLSIMTLPDLKLPKTTAQAIVVIVQAEPDRARKILAAIDWDALKKLLHQ